jgi:1,4-dihydroxy-2-naphthoyl-CoA hydrolase
MTDTTPDLAALMPFATRCGIRIVAATDAEVRGELAWSPDLCTAAGVMHGGALMTLADTVGAACAFLNLPAGATTTTIESKTNFFRALRNGTARAVATPLHVGRTIVVVQTDVRDDEGKRVALVTQTQAVLSPAKG